MIEETKEDLSLLEFHQTNTLETYITDPKADSISNDVEVHNSHLLFDTITMNTIEMPVSDIQKTVNGFLDIPPVETINAPKADTAVSDDDVEIDVDGDVNIEDEDDNSILKSRSASPNSVYEKLLQSANITKPFGMKTMSDNILEKSSLSKSSCTINGPQDDEPAQSNLMTNHNNMGTVVVEMETSSKSRHNSAVENSDESSNSSLQGLEKRIGRLTKLKSYLSVLYLLYVYAVRPKLVLRDCPRVI